MDELLQILGRDLAILEAMVAEMPAYLMSESTHWTMASADMPKLTIGGCLMRFHRLQELRHKLSPDDRLRLDEATRQFQQALNEKVVRFEYRTHQELRARLNRWMEYLSHSRSRMVADVGYYASVVDTRVVITATIDKLLTPPYQVEEEILRQVEAVDSNLQHHWQEGPFVWPSLWQPCYAPEKYWWLYGRPQQIST